MITCLVAIRWVAILHNANTAFRTFIFIVTHSSVFYISYLEVQFPQKIQTPQLKNFCHLSCIVKSVVYFVLALVPYQPFNTMRLKCRLNINKRLSLWRKGGNEKGMQSNCERFRFVFKKKKLLAQLNTSKSVRLKMEVRWSRARGGCSRSKRERERERESGFRKNLQPSPICEPYNKYIYLLFSSFINFLKN